ncbi:MAG: RHS repeat-associated core domain-containing protein [Planctomycetota bacterium]
MTRFGEATNGNQPNNVVHTLYDERDLVFRVTRGWGGPNQSTTQFDYDGNANLKKVSQGMGSPPRISTFEYDGFNRIIEANDPMGNVTERHYDGSHNGIEVHFNSFDLPPGPRTWNIYDELDRLTISETSFFDSNTQTPIGDGNSTTEYQYSDNSQVIKIIDDNGNETHFQYDTANRLGVVTDAKENTATCSYDENSNVSAITEIEYSDVNGPNETFTTTYQYDNLDRLTMVTDNNDNSTQFAYDSCGNRTRVTDALNNKTRCEYDGLSRLIRMVRDMDGNGADPNNPNDIKTEQTWDDSSRLTAQTDDNGNTTAYEYDALNRLTRIIYADDTDKQLLYDVHHNIIQTTDAIGTVVNSTYDLLNRVTARSITPGSGVSNDTTFENYEYDGLSRLVFAQDNDSNLIFSYDSLSNVTTETLNGQITTSVYDGLGNKLSCTYPGGRVITCTYDELSRKKSISADGNSVASYDYIGPARVERLSFGNNTQYDYSYDSAKRITATTHVFDPCGANTLIDSRTYQWDDTYNKTQRKDTRSGGPQLTHDYAYDPVNRLIQTTVTDTLTTVRDTDYVLDGVGNRTAVTGSPDPGAYTMDPNTPEPADANMNQYTTTPFDTRLYDKNGNLITIDYGQTTQKDIIYDYRNQMVDFNDLFTGVVATYAYDALGRRIEKVVDSGVDLQTTRYFYDGTRVVEEQDDFGTTEATYVYGNYIDQVLNMQRGPNSYFYHTDDIYNVMAVTDTNGLVLERYEYQDYGEPNFFDSTGGPIAASAIGNPYLFSGRRYDDETGWYYCRSRYLDPRAGRFITHEIGADNYMQYFQNPVSNELFLATGSASYSLRGHATLLTFTVGPPASPLRWVGISVGPCNSPLGWVANTIGPPASPLVWVGNTVGPPASPLVWVGIGVGPCMSP